MLKCVGVTNFFLVLSLSLTNGVTVFGHQSEWNKIFIIIRANGKDLILSLITFLDKNLVLQLNCPEIPDY